ncbi:TPA: prepilin-type N-terminal cleavage/methylation domain-containing protein [Vibrio parahaemolyticus]|uniref:PilW family protein n=1 Tax=Vibrio TaxID=662 RepID=UPI00193E21DA|nr:prepilin-type N-terminal cleavage/methylation domain-containing protein [Vibrio parahaemolyticus]BDP36303.1 MSHA biogenesis protein MshO [Vibrio alginolyticus]MBM5000388.1 prepilin-type N-terminal cleavage/methylation domain-containing protein [Vibrio parahaemolyticus]MCR9693801.1 prepilin-type N-terminal cleavage/methylation domain-containing protein [Vibrio parahaemolyticus]MCR9762716.1 prepilin-type N-terminal cleavage/methylation domain-containing protein [Vibrio parahaemolyticus]MDF493
MKPRGFTLMEMVITIVVGSIIMLGIAGYLQLGAKGYADTIDRQRLQTQAQFVIEKISREIRHAVPNSFFIDEDDKSCLQFMPIKHSGFYAIAGDDIEFVVGFFGDAPKFNGGLKMVINPTRHSDLSSSTHSVDVGSTTIDSNKSYKILKGAEVLTSRSVSNRHYIYDPSAIINYCFVGSEIQRNNQTIADGMVYADDQSQSRFQYDDSSLHRGGLVHLRLVFEQSGEKSVYQQDVQVLNVP